MDFRDPSLSLNNSLILVVDDEEVSRRILKLSLKKRGFQVIEAATARIALELAQKYHPDAILLDIHIPDMNGLEACRILKSYSQFQNPIVIFITASNELSDRVKAFQAGGADFITKPIQVLEVYERLKTHLRLRRAISRLAEAQQQLQARHEKLEADLNAAAVIQRRLLPVANSGMRGVKWGWNFRPSNVVSGDLLQIFRVDQQNVIAWILDVSGHGVDSGLLTVGVAQSIRNKYVPSAMPPSGSSAEIAAPPPTPQQLLRQIDREFPFDLFQKFMTLSVVALNRTNGEVMYATAGFPVPMLLAGSSTVTQLREGGPVIGMGETGSYSQGYARMEPGDRLCLATDGLFETTNSQGEPLGMERLERIFVRTSKLPVEQQVEQIETIVGRFRGRPEIQDDLSYLIISYEGLGARRGPLG